MKIAKPTQEYIAKLPCGCVVGLIAVIHGQDKETAKEVASFIRRGCSVNLVSRDSQDFRDAIDSFGQDCEQCRAPIGQLAIGF